MLFSKYLQTLVLPQPNRVYPLNLYLTKYIYPCACYWTQRGIPAKFTKMHIKRDKWTEDEILALPTGENDKFDRKSGAILKDSDFEEKLAKALSAFSNSGGGHLILGMKDDCTFDGVDQFHKGRAKTREWLEQKLPHLLTPVLQNFRVHDAEKATPTQIPAHKTVIIIDIGDSDLAPHQSNKDYHYYYRIGGHSAPAPHQHLELLWKREGYPGQQIAGAWVYKVINPLLIEFEAERDYLNREKWNYDRFRSGWLDGVKEIHQKHASGNYEQFYDSYPEIYQLIQKHDETVIAFIAHIQTYYEAIKNSQAMHGIFENTTSLESLEKLKNEEYSEWNYKIRDCKSADDFFSEMFGRFEKDEIIEALAQYTVNNSVKVRDNTFEPYWNVYSENFLSLNNCSCPEKTSFEKSRSYLRETIKSLLGKLKQERGSLCSRYQLPFEEPQQILIQYPQPSRFRL